MIQSYVLIDLNCFSQVSDMAHGPLVSEYPAFLEIISSVVNRTRFMIVFRCWRNIGFSGCNCWNTLVITGTDQIIPGSLRISHISLMTFTKNEKGGQGTLCLFWYPDACVAHLSCMDVSTFKRISKSSVKELKKLSNKTHCGFDIADYISVRINQLNRNV